MRIVKNYYFDRREVERITAGKRKYFFKEKIYSGEHHEKNTVIIFVTIFLPVITFFDMSVLPFIIDKFAEYYYVAFMMPTPVDVFDFESSVNKDFS